MKTINIIRYTNGQILFINTHDHNQYIIIKIDAAGST